MIDKVVSSAAAALEGVENGMSLSVGGFGVCGAPFTTLRTLSEQNIKDLTIYSNNPGMQDDQGVSHGIAALVAKKQVAKFAGSFIGFNKAFEKEFLTGGVEVELIPQGTLAERMRAGGAGIPAFYTPTGVGSAVADGGLPLRYDANSEVAKTSEPKETRDFKVRGEERTYVLEHSINTDFAIIRAHKADREGNCTFRLAAQNFHPAAAMCAKTTIVEVEELVEVGDIAPGDIQLQGIFVDRIVVLTPEQAAEKIVEAPPASKPKNESRPAVAEIDAKEPEQTVGWSRHGIAKRAAQEIATGQYVNLGIGLPTLVPDYVPEGVEVVFQSENGLLKTGPTATLENMDPDLINAGKTPVTLQKGAATFQSDLSFAMIRGGHVNTAILGALQVSENGDIANWGIPGKKMNGMGGAMDLVQGAQRVIAVLEHITPRTGDLRVLKECTYPLTAKAAISRIITNLCVFDVTDKGLELIELAPGVTEEQVRELTEADFTVSLWN